MENVFEFAALAMAAFPYRLLFLQIDRLEAFGLLMVVKFSYKINSHLIGPML